MQIWPCLEPKTESCFAPTSSKMFTRILHLGYSPKCKILTFILLLSLLLKQKWPTNRLKVEKLPFWAKFKAFGDLFTE